MRPANLLITGTPGTGKSTLSQAVAKLLNFNHIDIPQIVKSEGYHDGWDDEWETFLVDDEKVIHLSI
jgi:adenylate kinase